MRVVQALGCSVQRCQAGIFHPAFCLRGKPEWVLFVCNRRGQQVTHHPLHAFTWNGCQCYWSVVFFGPQPLWFLMQVWWWILGAAERVGSWHPWVEWHIPSTCYLSACLGLGIFVGSLETDCRPRCSSLLWLVCVGGWDGWRSSLLVVFVSYWICWRLCWAALLCLLWNFPPPCSSSGFWPALISVWTLFLTRLPFVCLHLEMAVSFYWGIFSGLL